MISNPKHGWCDFKIEDNNGNVFFGTPSYITNVPVDLLDMFVQYYKKGEGLAWFDEKGEGEFSLVLTPYTTYILEERDAEILHKISVPVRELAKELIEDIESDLDRWAKFCCEFDDVDSIEENKEIMLAYIYRLKRYI